MSGAEVAGVATGIVGAATGIGALFVAALGERRARRAERRAAEATAGAASLEVSLQRIANSFSVDRAETTRLIEALRAGPSDASRIAPPVLRIREPAFNLEVVAKDVYRLRNVGAAAATSVDITAASRPVGPTRAADGTITLAPMASTDPFVVPNTFGQPAPGELTVRCAELREPVLVPLPPGP